MLTLLFVDNEFIHVEYQSKLIKNFLTEHKNIFEAQLIGDLSHINNRADNINGIQIEEITHQSENEYCMSYTYDRYVYNGCSDMNEQDDEEGFVCFTVGENGDVEFDTPEFEERSTLNEF